jgi:hypothetical protein
MSPVPSTFLAHALYVLYISVRIDKTAEEFGFQILFQNVMTIYQGA